MTSEKDWIGIPADGLFMIMHDDREREGVLRGCSSERGNDVDRG